MPSKTSLPISWAVESILCWIEGYIPLIVRISYIAAADKKARDKVFGYCQNPRVEGVNCRITYKKKYALMDMDTINRNA
jgi:hypothetical protein